MTVYTLLCDIHLSEKTEETVFYILTYVANKIKHAGGKLAILGDFWDTCYKDGKIDGRLQRRVYQFFKDHFTRETLVMFPGNHDFFASMASEHALAVFDDVATVITDPVVDNEGVLWLPYRDDGYPESFIKSRKREGAKICFTHNDFRCLMMRKNMMSESGMYPDVFKGIKVYNGHYHYPNTHQIENGFIECVGSQYAVHTPETYTQKYLYEVDTTNISHTREKVRFGRREFTYNYSEVIQMDKDIWSHSYVHPSKPTTPDHLIILVPTSFDIHSCKLPENCDASITWRKVSDPVIHHKCLTDLDEQMNVYQLIELAAKHYFKDSPQSLDTSEKELLDNVMNLFKNKLKYSPKRKNIGKKHVTFDQLNITNFCNYRGTTLVDLKAMKDGTTKVVGDCGAGKTLRYSTALLYCVSGVVDSRFSEDRMLMSDLRRDKTKACNVTLTGTVSGKNFCIERTFTGRTTKLTYSFDNKPVKLPTIKEIQKAIAKNLFNVDIEPGTSPNKAVHNFLLQRVIWKQGGRESNILKASKDDYQKMLLSLVDKTYFLDLLKQAKKHLSEKRTRLKATKDALEYLKIRIDERKRVTRVEESGTKAWEVHRRTQLQALEQELEKLHQDAIRNPIENFFENYETFVKDIATGKKTKDDSFIALHTSFLPYEKQLTDFSAVETRISELVHSKEGLRWSPEMSLDNLSSALDEFHASQETIRKFEKEVDQWASLVNILQSIIETFVIKMGRKLEEKCDIIFSNLKILHVKGELDDTPLKYLSGGQYENHALRAFLSFVNAVQEYNCWSSNLLVFDEPGTHMDTTLLQAFVDDLPKDKINVVITHKAIMCDAAVSVSNIMNKL